MAKTPAKLGASASEVVPKYAANVDAITGIVSWPVERYLLTPDGKWSPQGTSFINMCPSLNIVMDQRLYMAQHLGVKANDLIHMEMVRMGATDRLGDAGWKVCVRRSNQSG